MVTLSEIPAPPVGSRVVYAQGFLRNIASPPTSELWRRKGKVTAHKIVGGRVLAEVLWDGENEPMRVTPSAVAVDGSLRANEDTPEYWGRCGQCGEPAQDRVKGHKMCPTRRTP